MARRSTRSSQGSTQESGKKKRSMFHRGSEAMDKVDEELEQQKVRKDEAMKNAGKPLRFFMKPGETKEIVILDDKPDFFLYEHTIKDPRTGKWGLNLPCIKEFDNCPVCEEVKESIYTMFLSILDLTGFEDSKGNWREFSRKLLCVKPSQQKKYLRRFHKEGTLRGAIFEVTRDGDMDATIGNDIEFIEFMDEEELANDYINEWKDRDGKNHVDNHGEVIDYESLFEEPTAYSLRSIVGGKAPAGSGRDRMEKDLDTSDDGWEDDEDAPFDTEGEDKKESRGSRSKRGSSRSSKRKSNDEEDNEGQERNSGSSRRSTRSRKEPEEGSERTSRSTRTKRRGR